MRWIIRTAYVGLFLLVANELSMSFGLERPNAMDYISMLLGFCLVFVLVDNHLDVKIWAALKRWIDRTSL